MATREQMKRWMEALGKPDFPNELFELTCGAKNRKGTPCKRKDLYSNGRCKFHGGLSTGPKTQAGKRRCTENLPWKKKGNIDLSQEEATRLFKERVDSLCLQVLKLSKGIRNE